MFPDGKSFMMYGTILGQEGASLNPGFAKNMIFTNSQFL